MSQIVQTRIYLDTSVLRGLGHRSTKALEGKCYTSALALLELLAGVSKDDNSYTRRRAVIVAILNAPPTSVVWELPDTRLLMCFSYVRENCTTQELRIEPLRRILECVRANSNRAAFIRAEQALGLSFPIEFFEQLDREIGAEFRKSTEKGNSEIRAAFNAQPVDNNIVPANILNGSFKDFCQWFRDKEKVLNFSTTVFGLARRVVDLAPSLPVEKVHDSYNGSIDVFVNAFSFASMTKTANMDLPGRNDALDLAHFLFLADGDALATNDGGMASIAEAIGVPVIGSSGLAINAE